MALDVEIVIPSQIRNGQGMLSGMAAAIKAQGHKVSVRKHYVGDAALLMLYGVGSPIQAPVRAKHLARGGRVAMWDAGYFQRSGTNGYLRLSIDRDHPQAFLDSTPTDPYRWDALGIKLRNDYHPRGPIILVGLGKKSRSYLRANNWEAETLNRLQAQYKGQRIVYRPKPKHPYPSLPVETDNATPAQDLLKGASLVVCRHSNMAVDAIVAGVPVECEDGAAKWYSGDPGSDEQRLDFLRRLAWWQWRPSESLRAWVHIRNMLGS